MSCLRGERARTARLVLEQGRFNDAAIALDRWLKGSPDSAEAHYLKARLAWTQDKLRVVEDELTRAEELGYSEQQLAGLKGLLLARGEQEHRSGTALAVRAGRVSRGQSRGCGVPRPAVHGQLSAEGRRGGARTMDANGAGGCRAVLVSSRN